MTNKHGENTPGLISKLSKSSRPSWSPKRGQASPPQQEEKADTDELAAAQLASAEGSMWAIEGTWLFYALEMIGENHRFLSD